jgi:amino acid adenylation domain-containing protein
LHRIEGPANPFKPFRRGDIELSIPARFAQQVRRAPGHVAVRGEDGTLTYGELDGLSNRVAQDLVLRLGQGPEPVALLMDQGVSAVIAVLAVLKTGKFYVPLEPEQTDGELTAMVQDSGARLIVAERSYGERARAIGDRGSSAGILDIEDCLHAGAGEPPALDGGPDNLAFIFYTSGSTGRPKGVFDNHRNVLHNALRYTNTLHITSSDRLTLLQSPSFSGTVSSLFSALLNGAAICPLNLREKTPSRLAEWMNQQGVTIYHSVPALFRSFLEGDRVFPSVRLIRLEGDLASSRDVELYRRHFAPECLLVNGLGITETGLVRQYFVDRQTVVDDAHLPVGYPVQDVECLLLDESGQQVGDGEVGEIAVRSEFMALGYWKNPELTRAMFSDGPETGAQRLFHSRDLGRLRPDGCLEYVGRADFRTKIRGQWVDLDRVEAVLVALPSVQEAVVVRREDPRGDLQIVGYVVSAADPSPSTVEIRRALLEQLPAAMVPSRYEFLDALPLSPNQKVDRRALPEPSWRAHEVFVLPWTLLEQQVAEVWEELLGVDAVGLTDDFFDLGGHSLLAIQMLDQIEQMFGTRIPPSFLLAGATINHLSQALVSDAEVAASPMACLNVGGAGPPLHFLHGDLQSGGVYARNLVRFLDDDQPFNAWSPLPLVEGRLPPTFEAMAATYVAALRRAQPNGPYLLGGLCNGGHVAFEMARGLRAEGESVDLLVMIRATGANVRHRLVRRALDAVGTVFRLDDFWRRRQFLRWWNFIFELERRSASERIAFTLGKLPRVAGRWMRRLHHREGDGQRTDSPADETTEATRRGVAYLRLEHEFMPRRYPGRIALFWPEDDEERPDEAAARWSKVADEVELHVLAGTHKTCVTKHVRALAGELQACLDRAVRGPS